jgi:hypothetical protein
MVPPVAEAPNGIILAAAAAALLPTPTKQSQISTPIFAVDIDSAEKCANTTATIPLEMKESSAPKASDVGALPIEEAEMRAEHTAVSSAGVNRYAEVRTAVDRAVKQLPDQGASSKN